MHVSVVIPCYNAERFLRETLGSIVAQTRPVTEIIVVNDGSKDDSARIAAEFDPRVRVINQVNQGESAARNRGIAEATGDWIALLDADDLWEPAKLERQLEAAATGGESVVCVYTDFYFFRDGKKSATVQFPANHESPDYVAHMLSKATVNTSSALLRAKVVKQVKFPEETRDAEDLIFFTSLRELGTFVRIPEPLVGYRVSGGNQSSRRDHALRSVRSCLAWFDRRADRYPAETRAAVYRQFCAKLLDAHEMAYWSRDHRTVLACRELYRQLHDGKDALPEALSRRLLPEWLVRFKDSLDARLFGRTRHAERAGELPE